MREWLIAVAMLALAVPHAAQAQRNRPSLEENLAALRKQEDRMILIGERLAVAAARAGWCDVAPSLGWTLGDLGQYPKAYRQQVRRTWGVPEGAALFVSSVVPESPAAQAGLQVGMGILTIDGLAPARNLESWPSRQPLAGTERQIDDSLKRGSVTIEFLRLDGARQRLVLTGRDACATRFEMAAEDDEQAWADGDIVQLTAGMGRYTSDRDAELAGVLAHELAHNILRHIPRSRDAGTPRNYTRHLGRYARISRKMEEEADRLSVWLLHAAGYDVTAPVAFWHRFGPGNDRPHPFGRLHDPWRARVAALEDEIALMRAALAIDPAARPALLDQAHVVPEPGEQ